METDFYYLQLGELDDAFFAGLHCGKASCICSERHLQHSFPMLFTGIDHLFTGMLAPLSGVGGSELADHEALLSTILVIPLAIGKHLHTILYPTSIVGLPRDPVGIDQGLP